jgi:hypothetical protein
VEAEMIAFEVKVNGKKTCTAGVVDAGVLSLMLTSVRRRVRGTGKATRHNPADHESGPRLHVGGLDSSDPTHPKHVTWLTSRLRVGDEVSVRIRRAKLVDAAKPSEVHLSESVQKKHRVFLSAMKRQLRRRYGKRGPDGIGRAAR